MRLLTGFFLCYVFFKRHGADLLFKGSETSIECSAEEDLTFKVISYKSNESFTIGECDLKIKTCHIFDTPLQNKISLSSTGRGGLMRINSLDEETVGTYICCETYNPNKCLSTLIVWPFQALVNNSENRPVQPIYISANNSGETSTDIAQYIGLSIGAAIGINIAICLSAFLILKRLRRCVFERAADSEYYSNHDYNKLENNVSHFIVELDTSEAIANQLKTENKRYDPYDDDDKTISSYEADEERHDDTLGEDIKETHETQFLEHVRQLNKEIREELQNIDFLEQRNRMRMELPEQIEETTPNLKTQMINDEEKDETQAANGEAIAMARAVCKRIESLLEAFVLTINRGDTTRT